MNYKTIRNKTYNNVLYIAGLLQTQKGYPKSESYDLAIRLFDSGDFQYKTVKQIFNNLLSYEQHLNRIKQHEYNKRYGYYEY